MAQWDDKHTYNWIGWMRSLLAMREKINDWTVSPKKAYKFPIFMANNTILSPILFVIVGIMVMLQTIEWLMVLIMRWVKKETDRDALDSIKGFPMVMVTLFILIPYAVTWGLPRLIQETIRERRKERAEERLRKQADELRQVEEDRRRWERLDGLEQAREQLEQQLRAAREIHDALDRRKKNDFRPRKIIKLHQFGDTPKLRIFTRDEFVVERNRVGNTSTARVRSRTRRGGILE